MHTSHVQVPTSERTDLQTCLLEGPPGSGKTALAATLGIESGFPFVKVISSADMMGFSEAAKAAQITRTIEDAYKVTAKHPAIESSRASKIDAFELIWYSLQ